jgi:putative S4 domain-containing protein
MKNINFLQQAPAEQREVAEKLLQSISFVENRNTVTKFLTNFEQIVLSQIVAYNYSDFKVEFFGGFDDAERKKARIISNEYYDVDYDIVCLKAKFNNKFNRVEHRNILGAVHNLGINFNRFGDIIVLENEVYIFVDEEIADYIAMEFTKAGRVNLDFQRVDLAEVGIEKKYEDFEIVSSSFRIDSIVAKITNKSRSKVKEFLEQDFIKLNHVILRNGEKTCTPDDIISIRKYGRYVVKGYTQNKKSLKYRITISKLV